MARRSHQVIRRGPTRETLWFEFQTNSTITAASTALLDFSLNAAALALRPFTIVRTRGELFSRSDQQLATEVYGGNWGIAVVSDQAAAIGVTAVPNPVSDYGSDLWLAIEAVHGQFTFATAASIMESGARTVIDSKAMRRVDVGQDVIVARETPSFSPSWRTTQTFRMLVKLH